MDKIKRINVDEFNRITVYHPFDRVLLAKDYYVTIILYLIREVEGIYFKGGTAINKILLSHARLSEDVDFSVTADMEEVKKKITEIITNSGMFEKITKDKDVK